MSNVETTESFSDLFEPDYRDITFVSEADSVTNDARFVSKLGDTDTGVPGRLYLYLKVQFWFYFQKQIINQSWDSSKILVFHCIFEYQCLTYLCFRIIMFSTRGAGRCSCWETTSQWRASPGCSLEPLWRSFAVKRVLRPGSRTYAGGLHDTLMAYLWLSGLWRLFHKLHEWVNGLTTSHLYYTMSGWLWFWCVKPCDHFTRTCARSRQDKTRTIFYHQILVMHFQPFIYF